MRKSDVVFSMLEKWWKTEPFGFDHPDTKNGILKLMEQSFDAGLAYERKRSAALVGALKDILKYSDIHDSDRVEYEIALKKYEAEGE